MAQDSGTHDNPTICFCYAVRKQDLIDAIRKGATTLYEIQMETQATTGCGGCEYEVLDLLEELLKPDAGPGAL